MTFEFAPRRKAHVARQTFGLYRVTSITSRGWMVCLWRWKITVSR